MTVSIDQIVLLRFFCFFWFSAKEPIGQSSAVIVIFFHNLTIIIFNKNSFENFDVQLFTPIVRKTFLMRFVRNWKFRLVTNKLGTVRQRQVGGWTHRGGLGPYNLLTHRSEHSRTCCSLTRNEIDGKQENYHF